MLRLMLLLALVSPAFADSPPPVIDIPALASAAARRFPQPIQVRDLLGQDVLAPVESQPVLGHVAAVARRAEGGVDMIIRVGGVLGIGTRPIAVPVEAMAWLGPSVVAVGFTPAELDRFPTAVRAAAELGPDERISVGIVRPFH